MHGMLASLALLVLLGNRVAFHELMVRPGGNEGEWVEILNRSAEPLRLEGWTLADATGRRRELPEAVVPPGGLAILAARPESLRARYDLPDSVPVLRPAAWPVLNDRDAARGEPADILVLADPRGVTGDSVVYHESWLPPRGGQSLERTDPALPGTEPAAWSWSLDPGGATPGRPSSLQSAADRFSDVIDGPTRVAPARTPALFRLRLPGPGRIAIWLVDRDGNEIAVLQEPISVAPRSRWQWGAGMPLPERGGPYFLCLRWRGEALETLRRCRTVWVER